MVMMITTIISGVESELNDDRSNIHKGHRKRLRKRFIENGLNSFQPHEIVEFILFYSIPRANTNELPITS